MDELKGMTPAQSRRFSLPPNGCLGWAYFLDIDGTLIELAETPDAVVVDVRLLGLVEWLYRASNQAMALVSGRSIADIDRLLGRPDIPVAGQHGVERRNACGVSFTAPPNTDSLAALAPRLTKLVRSHPALVLEDKGLSIAIHYRRLPAMAGYLSRLVRQSVAEHPGLIVQRGKCVLEIKPRGVDKGSAVQAFLSEPPFHGRTPVFIGDDATDENGFDVVNAMQGISIKVGPGRSCAKFRLPNVSAVRYWLSRLALENCE